MLDAQLFFGWRTALLGAAIVQCLLLALAVRRETGNAVANRWLAVALVVLAGMLTPYAIGFAGAYDRFRWLTFAPFAIPLALGPALYAYACALADGRDPPGLRMHLAPAFAQFAYLAGCFLLPASLKWSWYTGGHRTWVSPVLSLAAMASLAAYALAVHGMLRRRRARLADQRSDDDRFAAAWLGQILTLILISLGLKLGFWLWESLAGGIDYFQETGLYLALAGVGVYLGVAGWRHAALPVPLGASEAAEPDAEPARTPDWRAMALEFADRTRAGGWWREPDLTLADLARRLGTNSGRLSRAINLGLGVNFSTFINDLRAEAVADAIRAGAEGDLLTIALEMGFNSKASFNRAFRARHDLPPSQFRRHASDPAFAMTDAKMRRAAP